MNFWDPSGLDPIPTWATRINWGLGTNDDYWKALQFNLNSWSSHNLTPHPYVEKAVARAKIAKKSIFYDQTNPSWGSIMYSNHNDKEQTIGTSGCGPTSMAIIVATLKGNGVTPDTIAQYCIDNNFRTYNNGTANSFAASVASEYGLSHTGISDLKIINKLNGNSMVIVSVNGILTSTGHFVVISGVQVVDGVQYYCVYDPNYAENDKLGRLSTSNVKKTDIDGQVLVKVNALDKVITFAAQISK